MSDSIDISPKVIQEQSFNYGVLVKAIEDWARKYMPQRESIAGAKFLMGALAMISSNIEGNSPEDNEAIASFALSLYLNRKVVLEDGNSFAFPEWEKDVSPFDRDLGDLGMFAVFSSMGFKLGFDPIENSKLIYPYRPLILNSAREGYLLATPVAQAAYDKTIDFFRDDKDFTSLYEAICDALQ